MVLRVRGGTEKEGGSFTTVIRGSGSLPLSPPLHPSGGLRGKGSWGGLGRREGGGDRDGDGG